MMLTAYLTQVQNFLQNPPSSPALYSTTSLITYINTARMQLAGEAECVRSQVTFSMGPSVSFASFANAILPSSVGLGSVLSIRMLSMLGVDGVTLSFLQSRPWEWFYLYYFAGGKPLTYSVPQIWAQQEQGGHTPGVTAQASGGIYVNPATSTSGVYFNADAVCLPIALASDTDYEAIPYPWTDAVPFYATYYAYLSAQRPEDAMRYYAMYKEFALRGRQEVTPTVLPDNYQGGFGAKKAALKSLLTATSRGGQ